MNGTISKLTQLGQSLWYDNIQRKILENGEFKAIKGTRREARGWRGGWGRYTNWKMKQEDRNV